MVHYSNMIYKPLYLLILVFIGILLFVFAYTLFTSQRKEKKNIRHTSFGSVGDPGVCPICGSVLLNGEQIKSAVFPGQKYRLCHIFGCPHCYPYPEKGILRKCPVCHKPLPPDGYLVARLFDRTGKKKHVHILGCTTCRLTANHT